MPKVGAKEFPYTREGIAQAKDESRSSGQPIRSKRGYKDVARAQRHRARHKRSIADAIKRPGALTAAVGGKPSENTAKVEQLAKHGSPLQKKQSAFYLNVLRKGKS